MSKQYGLSFPKQNTGHKISQVSLVKPSVFNDDSDNEEQQKPTGISRTIKKLDIISQEKAIADDPTVYQYDEVYDDIEKKRHESKLAGKSQDKTPKYINKLLAAAEKRKRENDRRIERQVQKEREEEGDTFKDKESFITPSYKKKLEELRQLEEEEKREEYLETIGDVRKQGNLDGFYRHLYDQKINYTEKGEEQKDEIKTEIIEDEVKKEPSEEFDNNEEKEKSIGEVMAEGKSNKITKKRKYRSRRNSESDSNGEELDLKKQHLPSNIDADSDFSVDSSDSDEEENKKDKKEETIKENKPDEIKVEVNNCESLELSKKLEENVVKEEVKVKPKKIKVDVWKKRTVNEKFDEAVKRYFERKAIREMGQ